MYKYLGKELAGYGITIDDKISIFLRGENNTLGDEEKRRIADLIKDIINKWIVYPIMLVAAPKNAEIVRDRIKEEYKKLAEGYRNSIRSCTAAYKARWLKELADSWADGNYYDCTRLEVLKISRDEYGDLKDEFEISPNPYDTLKRHFEICIDYVTDGEELLYPYMESQCKERHLPFIQKCWEDTIKEILDVYVSDSSSEFPDIKEQNERTKAAKEKKREIIEEKYHVDKVIRLIMKRLLEDRKPDENDIVCLNNSYKEPLDDISDIDPFINAFISVFEENVRLGFNCYYKEAVNKECLSILAERIKKTGKQYSGSEKNGVAMIKFLKEEAGLEIFEEMGVYIESLKNDSIKDVLRDWIDQSYRVSCI